VASKRALIIGRLWMKAPVLTNTVLPKGKYELYLIYFPQDSHDILPDKENKL
jgi:hypothetical protein